MSQLFGMSFDAAASPTISLPPWRSPEVDEVPSGWGFGWYPGDEYAAVVIKDPFSVGDTAVSRVLADWDRFRGTMFLCHIRGAAKRATQQDTHPFRASMAGRDFLLAHTGALEPGFREHLPLGDVPLFEPVGRTDSEHMLCWLLTQLRGYGCRRLADMGWERLHELFKRINSIGTANVLLSDGQDLIGYRDQNGFAELGVCRRLPPHKQHVLSNRDLTLSTGDPMDRNRTYVIVSTTALGEGFREMEPGEMVVARRGAVTYTSHPNAQVAGPPTGDGSQQTWVEAAPRPETAPPPGTPAPIAPPASAMTQTQANTAAARPAGAADIAVLAPTKSHGRVMRVVHETTYDYEQPVELSTHLFRLQPVIDRWQELVEHSLEISPSRPSREFEDVFGNHTRRLHIDVPFKQLRITASSVVRVRATPRLASTDRRTSIPLVWMPWQRQMMNPYLLPPELPETQLRELSDFAMSFVERQDFNLVDTIHDINQTIYRDFAYVSGSTNLSTTPFDVYINRRGVCQDFANLFICLTRLLGVPARYRVGYIHTGADYENKIQSEASHAWAEVYLPQIGWRGFDPTNGCKAEIDHIRVAAGRTYQDATPTKGTLYKGGGKERLNVNVRVDILDED